MKDGARYFFDSGTIVEDDGLDQTTYSAPCDMAQIAITLYLENASRTCLNCLDTLPLEVINRELDSFVKSRRVLSSKKLARLSQLIQRYDDDS
jgi:hypothetical protein